jgi:protein-tyrosine kinase
VIKKQPSPVYPSEPDVTPAADFFSLQEWESRGTRHAPSQFLSREAEPFRALRSQLMLRWLGSEDEHRSIAILSPDRNEGRTHIAANLALVFAELGQFTLLIDADLRNPRLHTLFNINNATGLSTVLADGEAKVQRIDQFPSLTVLTSGRIPADPEELLSRESFSQLIDLVRESYDVVIIDTPAAGSGIDAYIIAARAKAGLIVARRNVTRVAHLDSLRERVGVTQATMLGIVHNEG